MSAPITNISRAAPAVVTAVAHGVPDGWPVAVVSAEGMYQINATRYPPVEIDWHAAKVLTPDTVALNDINSSDFSTYKLGGYLVYHKPVPLDNLTATMTVFAEPDFSGLPVATLSNGAGLFIDSVGMTIVPVIQTAGALWDIGYYELMATDGNGVVTRVMTGTISID